MQIIEPREMEILRKLFDDLMSVSEDSLYPFAQSR